MYDGLYPFIVILIVVSLFIGGCVGFSIKSCTDTYKVKVERVK
jgi:hypothetical protein